MATSKKKCKTPRLAFIDEEKPKRPTRKKKKLVKNTKKRKLRSFHGTPDRFTLSHLAKVLTSGERLAMLNAVAACPE